MTSLLCRPTVWSLLYIDGGSQRQRCRSSTRAQRDRCGTRVVLLQWLASLCAHALTKVQACTPATKGTTTLKVMPGTIVSSICKFMPGILLKLYYVSFLYQCSGACTYMMMRVRLLECMHRAFGRKLTILRNKGAVITLKYHSYCIGALYFLRYYSFLGIDNKRLLEIREPTIPR